jgi:hypothetical protein
MSERNCTLYRIDDTNLCEPDRCYLLEALKHQAEKGGWSKEGRPAGPIWTEDRWSGFCNRTKFTAEQGCGIEEEIKREIERITDEKRRSGHFKE